jgi:prepilin-type N-terminal cleavage/methylation domain-containing protein
MKLQNKYAQLGFSLVEMAIVLVILGFVLSALLLPLQAQRQQIAQSQTEKTLEIAKQALLGYAQQHGRLPCPATAANGAESPLGGGGCTQQVGFLPAATLGVQPADSKGFAIDAWNNPIRYAVTQTNVGGAATPDFTTSNDLSTVGIPLLNPNLTVCNDSSTSSCSATAYLTNNSVAAIYSTGANGALSNDKVGADEVANKSATTTFYSRTPTAKGTVQGEFDDMVTWISPYVLYNSMIQAGQLH